LIGKNVVYVCDGGWSHQTQKSKPKQTAASNGAFGAGKQKQTTAAAEKSNQAAGSQAARNTVKQALLTPPGTEVLFQSPTSGSAMSVASNHLNMLKAQTHRDNVNETFAQGSLVDMQVRNTPSGAQKAYTQAKNAYTQSLEQYRKEQTKRKQQESIQKIGIPTIDEGNMFYSVLKDEAIQAAQEPFEDTTVWERMRRYDADKERLDYLGNLLGEPTYYLSLDQEERQEKLREWKQLEEDLCHFWDYGAELGHDMKNLRLMAQMQNDYEATALIKKQFQNLAEERPAVAWGTTAALTPWNGLSFVSQSAQMLRNQFLPESEQRPINFYNDANLPMQVSDALEDGLKSRAKNSDEEILLEEVLRGVRHGSNLAATWLGTAAVGAANKDIVAVVTSILDGTGKGGQKFLEEKERGSSDHVALRKATVEAFTEIVTQSPILERILSRSAADGMAGILQSGLEKGTQEGVESIFEIALDYCLSGKESDFCRTVEMYQEQGYAKEKAEKTALNIYAGEVALEAVIGSFSGGVTYKAKDIFDKALEQATTETWMGQLLYAAGKAKETLQQALLLPEDDPANVLTRQHMDEKTTDLWHTYQNLKDRAQRVYESMETVEDYAEWETVTAQMEDILERIAESNTFDMWLDSRTLGMIEKFVKESMSRNQE